jgi:hypothetical protein
MTPFPLALLPLTLLTECDWTDAVMVDGGYGRMVLVLAVCGGGEVRIVWPSSTN